VSYTKIQTNTFIRKITECGSRKVLCHPSLILLKVGTTLKTPSSPDLACQKSARIASENPEKDGILVLRFTEVTNQPSFLQQQALA